MESVLGGLWESHLTGLWTFASEGDAGALAAASKHLLSVPDPDGNTALHLAVRNRQPFALNTLLATIKGPRLLLLGAEFMRVDLEGTEEAGAIVNARNLRKQTPLHLAVRFSDAESLHYLVAAGAARAVVDADGNSPAHYLAETFSEDIYRDLLAPPGNTVAGWLHLV